jgi:glutamate dehydrogenase/leucine dehydrogenase
MTAWHESTEQLLSDMAAADLTRGYVVQPIGADAPIASHPVFEPIRDALIADAVDYDAHLGAFFAIGPDSGHLLTAFVHRTIRGQGAGGARFWAYDTVEGLVRDGLRLSRGMSHKNALAGLWWGGGKGIIARRPGVDVHDPAFRERLFRDFGQFITSLRGLYVTAEDAGTTPPDIAHIFDTTRHTTCIPPALGGSGNPSVLTARGVVVAMEAALEARGMGTLEGKTIASEGLGNVARYMVGELLQRGVKRIVAVDIDPRAIAAAHEMHADDRLEARQVDRGDTSILATPCDVLAPNAIGATLNDATIPGIEAPIVCGAANNQLKVPARHAAALHARDILYVPDFLANRMGIVNCANEQYGVIPNDPAILAHLQRDTPTGIFQRTLEVLRMAEQSGRTPADEAVTLADALCAEPHPIWGDRGSVILDALLAEGWA